MQRSLGLNVVIYVFCSATLALSLRSNLWGVLLAARRVYSRRSRERVVSHEGLDDPEVAQGFNRIAKIPF